MFGPDKKCGRRTGSCGKPTGMTVLLSQLLEFYFQFQSDIKGDYSKFVRENFSDFISSMGGFSDIADYISRVKSGPHNLFNVAAVAVGGLAAGFMWFAKKL